MARRAAGSWTAAALDVGRRWTTATWGAATCVRAAAHLRTAAACGLSSLLGTRRRSALAAVESNLTGNGVTPRNTFLRRPTSAARNPWRRHTRATYGIPTGRRQNHHRLPSRALTPAATRAWASWTARCGPWASRTSPGPHPHRAGRAILVTAPTDIGFPVDCAGDTLKVVVQCRDTHAQVLDLDIVRLDATLICTNFPVQIGGDRTINARAMLMLIVMDHVRLVVLILVLILILESWRSTHSSLRLVVSIVFTLGCRRSGDGVVSVVSVVGTRLLNG